MSLEKAKQIVERYRELEKLAIEQYYAPLYNGEAGSLPGLTDSILQERIRTFAIIRETLE
jgi:hypothetical protein